MKKVNTDRKGHYNPWSPTPTQFDRPETTKLMGAAIRQENDVYNAWEFLHRPDFPADPEFNILQAGEQSPHWDEFMDQLAGAQSQQEFTSIEKRIDREVADREIFAAAGTTGALLSGMAAGALSPTMLIPLTGPSRGARGVVEAFALAGAAATTQEAVLLGNQETRTNNEVLLGIGAGTLLGGLLGSAAVAFRGGAKGIERAALDMAGTPRDATILKTTPDGDVEYTHVPMYNVDEAFDIIIPRKQAEAGDATLGTTILNDPKISPYELPKKYPVDVSDALASNAVHAAARATDPVLFRRVDDLLVRQTTYRKWISQLQEGGQLSVDRILATLNRQLEDLIELRKSVQGKKNKALIRSQIRGKHEELSDLSAAREGANAADIAELRKQLQGIDEKLRDESQGIGKAYQIVRDTDGGNARAADEALASYTSGKVMDASEVFGLPSQRSKLFPEFTQVKKASDVDAPAPQAGKGGGSLSAASRDADILGLDAPNRVVQKVIETAAHLNPVGRSLTQQVSPRARYWVAQLHDMGARIVAHHGDPATSSPVPSALGGTASANIEVHSQAVGKLIRQIDDAYSRHVFGAQPNDEQLKSAFFAQVKSGMGMLPEGKLTMDEFNREAFKAMNTLEPHADPFVMQLKGALDEFFGYYRNQEAGAFEDVKLRYGEDASRLIPEEFNLGPGVLGYIHHMWDQDKVVTLAGELKKDLTEMQLGVLSSRFAKDFGRFEKRRAKLQNALDIQQMSLEEVLLKTQSLVSKVEKLDADPEVQYGNTYLRNLRKDLEQSGTDPAATKEQMGAARTSLGSGYADKMASRRQARAELLFIAKAREELTGKAAQKSKKILDEITTTETELRKLREGFDEIPTAKAIDDAEELQSRIYDLEDELLNSDDLSARIRRMEDDFEDKWQGRGAEGSQITRGLAEFGERAAENAELLVHRLKGDRTRVSGLDILAGKRGPELARGLNLPFEKKLKYLVTDVETIARAYNRHMGSDIELWRRTGSVNGKRIFDEVAEDLQNAENRIIANTELSEKAKESQLRELEKARHRLQDDFRVMIERLRHQRGRPNNPDGIGYRLGRVAKATNVSRFMGTVMISSVADVGRPVMQFGLMNTFKHGWLPLVSDLKKLKASKVELRRYGLLWDTVMHNRTQQIFDLAENYAGRQTMFERGVEFLANKTGAVAFFDWWTQSQKHIAGNVVIGVLNDALEVVNNGSATGKRLTTAKQILLDAGFDDELTRRIWDQHLLENGSDVFDDGFRLPNTEAWEDVQAIRAYSNAVNKFVNDTIVTPGVDRPNWMDENIGFSLIAQFRSFNFTATNRTIVKGLQQSDMAVMNGVMVSLAMGAISYYTWAMTIGGTAKEQMLQATPADWSRQAVNRSGLLGALGEVQRVGENVPGLSDLKAFGGGSARTRRPTSLMGAIAGPSFDLAERLATVVQNMDNPTASTVHQVRTMLAYQNVFYLRRLFDAVEEGIVDIGDIPERRN